MKLKINITLLIISAILLANCSSIKQSNNEIDENFNEKDVIVPRVQFDESGLISKVDETGAPKDSENESVELCNTGDYKIVLPNKNYQFDFRNFNPKKNTLATEITPNGDMFIRVVDINANKVLLKEKCQSQIWYTTSIPIVEVMDGNKEQVIITPIFKDDCTLYAYEIRLGSVESGCGTPKVKEILKKRRDCRGQIVKRNIVRSKKVEIFNPYN